MVEAERVDWSVIHAAVIRFLERLPLLYLFAVSGIPRPTGDPEADEDLFAQFQDWTWTCDW